MDYRPNSGPERKSCDIGPDSHNFPLSEYLTIQHATILWEEPKHTSYNSKTARLRSYVNWPHGMNPSPESLIIAGLFYTITHFYELTMSYRSGWYNKIFSLWRRTTRLASYGRFVDGACPMVSLLCIRSIYQRRGIYSRLSKLANTKIDTGTTTGWHILETHH